MDMSYEKLCDAVMRLLPKFCMDGTLIGRSNEGGGAHYISKRTGLKLKVSQGAGKSLCLLNDVQQRKEYTEYPAVLIGMFLHDMAKELSQNDESAYAALRSCFEKAVDDLVRHNYVPWSTERRYMYNRLDQYIVECSVEKLNERELAEIIVRWFVVLTDRVRFVYGG